MRRRPLPTSPRQPAARVAIRLGLLAALLSGQPAAACSPSPLAVTPLTDNWNFLVIRAAIGGQSVSLLLDTGSDGSLITPDAARRLALPIDTGHDTLLSGTGGRGGRAPNIRLRGLSVGGLALPERSVPVGEFPTFPTVEPPVAGLIGGDLLAGFTLDIDVPGHRLGLFRPSGACGDDPPWPGADRVTLVREGLRLFVPVRLAGHALEALVDTGSRSIALDTGAAARLGLSDAVLARDPGGVAAGIDLRPVIYRWHVFPTLAVGTSTLRRPVVTVEPLADNAMLLGAPFFAARRVWLSYRGAWMGLAPPARRLIAPAPPARALIAPAPPPPAPAAGASAR